MPVETAFDLPCLFEAHWPSPICPKDGTHQWVTVEASHFQGLICDCCGSTVRLTEWQAVMEWWGLCEAYSREDWGRN